MSKTSEREHMLHERLKAAYDRDVVTFYTNFDKLHSPSCPVFDPWLAGGPLLGLLMLAVTVLFLGGLVAGTLAIIIAAAIYAMAVRPWMETQFRDRAIKMALKDIKSFQTLWDYGGIGIAMTKRPETIIAAPEGPWKAFLAITLPLSIPGIIAGCMLVFIPAVGEFVIPDLLGGASSLMIGKVLWNEFFQNRDWPAAAAVAVAMLVVLVLPIVAFQRYQLAQDEKAREMNK